MGGHDDDGGFELLDSLKVQALRRAALVVRRQLDGLDDLITNASAPDEPLGPKVEELRAEHGMGVFLRGVYVRQPLTLVEEDAITSDLVDEVHLALILPRLRVLHGADREDYLLAVIEQGVRRLAMATEVDTADFEQVSDAVAGHAAGVGQPAGHAVFVHLRLFRDEDVERELGLRALANQFVRPAV